MDRRRLKLLTILATFDSQYITLSLRKTKVFGFRESTVVGPVEELVVAIPLGCHYTNGVLRKNGC